jgi:hypothetical protein
LKRIRVAVDANIPKRIIDLLKAGFQDQGYEFFQISEFANPRSADEFWADAFKRFGGEIVITADSGIARRPHQIRAFEAAGLKTFFFEPRWMQRPIDYKSSHVIFWWPKIAEYCERIGPGRCYWVPVPMKPNLAFARARVSNAKKVVRRHAKGRVRKAGARA